MTLSSLRGRFLLAILLWVAVGIGAIWYSSVRLFAAHVEAQFHEELAVHVRELGALTELDARGRPYLTRPLSDPRYALPLSGYYWQVTRPRFGTIKSPSMTRGGLNYDIAHSANILHRNEDGPTGKAIVYGFVRDLPQEPPLHFVIATDQRHLDRLVKAFTRELFVWLALLALALLASGLAIITLGFRPFNRLSAAIDRLRRGDATSIEGHYPDELQLLVSDLNAYVSRNEEIVERGRVEAGALAHSLRTPLAVMTDEAERLRERDEGSATVFLQESDKMQRQIDYRLARARSGGSRIGVAAQARLADVLPPLVSAMARCHPDKRFTVASDLAQAPVIAMDPDDLGEILSNILDNGGKWAAHKIAISTARQGDMLSLFVDDDGPGIRPELAEALFAVGRTGGEGPVGTGLGLAIARDLARDYGGDIRLAASPSGGCRVEIAVPPVA